MELFLVITIVALILIYIIGYYTTNRELRTNKNIFRKGFVIVLGIVLFISGIAAAFFSWQEMQPKMDYNDFQIWKTNVDNQYGFAIQFEGTYKNLRHQNVQIRVDFYDNKGNPIVSKDGRFEKDNITSVSEEVHILMDRFQNTQTLFIPFEEIDIKAENDRTPFYALITVRTGANFDKILYEKNYDLTFPKKLELLFFGSWEESDDTIIELSPENRIYIDGKNEGEWRIKKNILALDYNRFKIIEINDTSYKVENMKTKAIAKGTRINEE